MKLKSCEKRLEKSVLSVAFKHLPLHLRHHENNMRKKNKNENENENEKKKRTRRRRENILFAFRFMWAFCEAWGVGFSVST